MLWLLAIPLGWSSNAAVFWYLGFCTFVSFATQFTLAYQNRRSEAALEQALRNMTDLMRLMVAIAREIKGEQQDILEAVEDLVPDLASPHMGEAPLH